MKLDAKKMLQLLSFSSPLISLIFSLLSISNADSNIYVQCSQFYFNSLTPYESSVNSLFTSILDSATVSNFNKFEISQNDVVYGLFQCQGDLTTSSCKECVTNAVSQLKTTCHVSTSGTIQLEECFVKYDNKSFFGADDKMEVLKRCGPLNSYNSDGFNHMHDAMAYLITGNGQYFHGGDLGRIQGVAQCIQDLSLSDCQDCLLEASGRLRSECNTSTWGDVYLGKCYIRYVDQGDDEQVYNINSSYNNNNSHHGGENNIIGNKAIGYIAAAVAGGGLTFAVIICIKYCKRNGSAANKEEGPKEQAILAIDKDCGTIKLIHDLKKIEYNMTEL